MQQGKAYGRIQASDKGGWQKTERGVISWLSWQSSFPAQTNADEDDSDVESPASDPATASVDDVSRRTAEENHSQNREEVLAITLAQRALVHKLHVNLGHPTSPQLFRTLQIAGARERVTKYVRQTYRCPTCSNASGPAHTKQLLLELSGSIALVTLDTFSLHCVLPSNMFDLRVLNVICHGANSQVLYLWKLSQLKKYGDSSY